jgi:hypothetical protein
VNKTVDILGSKKDSWPQKLFEASRTVQTARNVVCGLCTHRVQLQQQQSRGGKTPHGVQNGSWSRASIVAVPSTRFWFGSTMEQLNCSLVGPISNQHGTTTQTVTMQLHVGTVCNVTGKQSSHSPSTDSFLRPSVCSLEQLAVTTAQCLTLWDGTRAKGGDCKSCTWTRSITTRVPLPTKSQQIMGF